jgi:hypothetical protein
MGILIVGGILFGMILGQFFKWFILVPACGLASVLALANAAHMDGFLGWPLQIVVVTASLQIGYFLGLVARSLSARRASASAVSTRHRQVSLKP